MKALFKRGNPVILFTTILFAVSFLSCKKEGNPIVPDGRPLLTPADYRKLVVTMTDYDVVRVTHQFGLDLRVPNVVRIGIGAKDSTGFKQLSSTPATFDQGAQSYIIRFDFSARFDSTLTVAPLTVRYFKSDSTYADADTTVALYKYPYKSAEIFLPYSILPNEPFQDIARKDTLFFFHPFGPRGLYVYNLVNHQTRLLFDYASGDHIAADSIFVFCDVSHSRVYRYNRLLNSFDLNFMPSPSIAGLATYNGFLYVLGSVPSDHLKKFTYDGTLVDSIPYPKNTYYMMIHNGILYSVKNDPTLNVDFLTRFDLATRTFLPRVRSPWKWEDGIKAHGNSLYFCNYHKKFVGVMPVADLAAVDSTTGASAGPDRIRNRFR